LIYRLRDENEKGRILENKMDIKWDGEREMYGSTLKGLNIINPG
jgi:hypothetical protein